MMVKHHNIAMLLKQNVGNKPTGPRLIYTTYLK